MTIENTTKRDPLRHLFGMTIEGTPDYIENMEAAGQTELVNSTKLPTDISWQTSLSEYEALGFTFGEVDDDGMFQEATLPEGWSRQGSSHAMWSHIVDERGLKRVAIFYKAAFYDRSAHMSIIDPGRDMASSFFFGEADGVTLDNYELLTEDERASFAVALDDMDADIERHPRIYGKYAHRLAEAREVVSNGNERD